MGSEQVKSLKALIYRLNRELAQYQAKYQPPTGAKNKMFPKDGPVPQWMVSSRHLSPLFLAYDEQLAEKNNVIAEYKEQLSALKARVHAIVQENHNLQIGNTLSGEEVRPPGEWS